MQLNLVLDEQSSTYEPITLTPKNTDTNINQKTPKSRHDKQKAVNCAQIISKLMHFVRFNAEIFMIFNQKSFVNDLFTTKQRWLWIRRTLCVCVRADVNIVLVLLMFLNRLTRYT